MGLESCEETEFQAGLERSKSGRSESLGLYWFVTTWSPSSSGSQFGRVLLIRKTGAAGGGPRNFNEFLSTCYEII